MKYDSFHYIYPPRPKNPIPCSELSSWDNGLMLAQPKLNGSNCVIFMNENDTHIYNRHGERLSNFKMESDEIRSLYRGDGWIVLNGEYLNKSKKDECGNPFNLKLVLFDILVYKSTYLLGTSFTQRVSMMDEMFGTNLSDKEYLLSVSPNVYRVKTYENGFKNLYDDFTKIDILEGLVLKRKTGKLQIGNTEINNHNTQIKCRKSTKNYSF